MNKLNSWILIPKNSDFSIYNLPFGIFSTSDRSPRVGIAIGDQIVDMYALKSEGLLAERERAWVEERVRRPLTTQDGTFHETQS